MHPDWIKKSIMRNDSFLSVENLINDFNINTVCQEASCPNIYECWSEGTATFMILGDVCSRGCRFCHVKKGLLGPIDNSEKDKIVEAVKKLGLKYIVLTSVDRDDLPDQGSGHFSSCIKALKGTHIKIECLIPDFTGRKDLIKNIIETGPDVIAHNVETVRRLQILARDARASYEQSLAVLKFVKEENSSIYTKSTILLGMGEKKLEITQTMEDLRKIDVDILVLSQYLQPSKSHLPVNEYIKPEKFNSLKETAEDMGFVCASGPWIRTSYKAHEFFNKCVVKNEINRN